jgi:hypothetical protein
VRPIVNPPLALLKAFPRHAARNRNGNDPATRLLCSQHDLPHQATGSTVDAGHQLRLAGEPTAAVVAHTGEEIADRHGALTLGAVRLVRVFSA